MEASTIFSPYPINGQVDTTAIPVDIISETEYVLKSILIQNTHASNNLTVFFLGQGEAKITLFPKTNISLTVEDGDRLSIRKIYVKGSGSSTTFEILSLVGPTKGQEVGEPQ